MTTTTQGAPLQLDTESRRNKILYGCFLLAVGVVCGVLTPIYGFWPGFVSFLAVICGSSVIAAARKEQNVKGACPSCGGLISDVERNVEGIACTHCGGYALLERGRFFAPPDDHVAQAPLYAIPLEPGAQLPVHDCCVGCGAHATHTFQREVSKLDMGIVVAGKKIYTWNVSMPLCETHARPDEILKAGASTMLGGFQVRSYRYWRLATKRA